MRFPDYKTITVEDHSGIAIIRLNRPDKRNALNEAMVNELSAIFGLLRGEKNINSVLLTGNGSAFCSGADLEYLRQLQKNTDSENLNDSIRLKNLFRDIYLFPKPTLAVVNGPALAGGCGLVSVFDFSIATEQAIFGYPEVKIGFVAAIVSYFLTEIVGRKKALELLISGEILSAQSAFEYRLISKVSTSDTAIEEGLELLRGLRNNSATAMMLTKKLVKDVLNDSLEEKLNRIARFNADARKTKDFYEGLNSFLEKRKPEWVTE
jgi:methylglutaconyl-CoA hydratase